MKDYADIAKRNFAKGYNCGQAVFLPFAADFGIDEKTAAKLACCLGGGFSQTGGICGAVSGACIAVSAKLGRQDHLREGQSLKSQQLTYGLVQKIQEKFKQQFGSTDCPSLLEHGLNASGDAKNDKFLCSEYVRQAAAFAADAIESNQL